MVCVTACSNDAHVGGMYSKGQVKGIILDVSDDGVPSLVLSIDEISGIDADSAARWAAGYSDGGWRLPTVDEARLIEKNRYVINGYIEKRGLKVIGNEGNFYWTGTDCSKTHVNALGPYGVRCYFRTNSSNSYRARAVRQLI